MFSLFKKEPVYQPFDARGRTWQVDTNPVSPDIGTYGRRMRFAGKTRTALIVDSSVSGSLRSLTLTCMASVLLAVPILCIVESFGGMKGNHPPESGWQRLQTVGMAVFMFAGCLLMIWFGLWARTQTVRADKRLGTITRRWLLKTMYVLPLERVIAVQWLALGGRGYPEVNVWQVNLVLASPPAGRVNVCTEAAGTFTEELADELAEFLGVPLIRANVPGKR